MTIEKIENNPILKLSLEFSLHVIEYCDLLTETKKFVIANQLLKSGTSIGANAFEAQNAESKADFIHKFKIAAKEAEETQYWLLLCEGSKSYPSCIHLKQHLLDINRLLGSILKTSKTKII